MRGQALIAGGWSLIIMGLFVLSPALWLILDQSIQQITGAPLVGIVIGGGGIIVPLGPDGVRNREHRLRVLDDRERKPAPARTGETS